MGSEYISAPRCTETAPPSHASSRTCGANSTRSAVRPAGQRTVCMVPLAAGAPSTVAAVAQPGMRSATSRPPAGLSTSTVAPSAKGYAVRSARVAPPGSAAASGAYSPTATPPLGVLYTAALASLGQPWLKLAVQQPKLGSRPYISASGPSCCHTCGCAAASALTSFTACRYWCAHMSPPRGDAQVAGRALKAMRSARSAYAGSPNTPNMVV
mmetsp:Transcript_40752/g.102490  ORF Transcript_40752/g.102490 Transcript_40752/m.102490 type:complete len:212 (+) Transcript_40752:632-1267(+)